MLKIMLAAIVLVSCAMHAPCKPGQLQTENVHLQRNKVTAVLELFTSEGCSSCPAADKLASQLKDFYKGNLVVLEFHVDYWDRLGWKDPFSKAAYTQRQRQYSASLNLESIYTPQAVVNGVSETVGSDEKNLRHFIDNAISTGNANSLIITAAEGASKSSIKVRCIYAATSAAVIHVALVQKHAVTQVQAGENEGRKLAHTNIVRDFVTISDNDKEVLLEMPPGIPKSELMIVAYAQEKSNGKIPAAATIENW